MPLGMGAGEGNQRSIACSLGSVDKGWRGDSRLIQGCFLEAALGERIELSDEEWALIGPLLPPERRRGCRPARDNRLERMMWMADRLAIASTCRTNMASGTASSAVIRFGLSLE